MPNNGTRIYTENGKGIDLRADVYKVLGITRRRNGYDLGYACTNTHGKINPWAKYKPVITLNPFSESFWKGDDGKCGFIINVNTEEFHSFTKEDILNFYRDATNWTYNPPSGTSDWKCLGHFDGYVKNAIPFIQSAYKKGVVYELANSGGVITGYIGVRLPAWFSDEHDYPLFSVEHNLQISDFYFADPIDKSCLMKDGYLAAIVVNQSSNPLANGFANIGFDLTKALRINDKKLSEKDGDKMVITNFSDGTSYSGSSHWIILGIVWGHNNRLFTGLPFDDDNYPAFEMSYSSIPRFPRAKISGWAKNPYISSWRSIKWIATEDTIAVPATTSSFWQLRMTFSSTDMIAAVDLYDHITFKDVTTGKVITPMFIKEDFSTQGEHILLPNEEGLTYYVDISDLFAISSIGQKTTIQCFFDDRVIWQMEFQGASTY